MALVDNQTTESILGISSHFGSASLSVCGASPTENIAIEDLQERRLCIQSFPVVLCDLSAHFNLAFRLTRSGFLELRDEAALTLSRMDKCRDGGFEEIFMTKIDYPAKYDYCISFQVYICLPSQASFPS